MTYFSLINSYHFASNVYLLQQCLFHVVLFLLSSQTFGLLMPRSSQRVCQANCCPLSRHAILKISAKISISGEELISLKILN